MNEPNEPELMLAMAKLAEKLAAIPIQVRGESVYWTDCGRPIRVVQDTEWLYVMHLVEQTLSMGELVEYEKQLNHMELKNNNYGYVERVINATFNQRARAMLAVKGVGK